MGLPCKHTGFDALSKDEAMDLSIYLGPYPQVTLSAPSFPTCIDAEAVFLSWLSSEGRHYRNGSILFLSFRSAVLNLWVTTVLTQGLPKTTRKHRYLHYDL